jgi:hypothetical protein
MEQNRGILFYVWIKLHNNNNNPYICLCFFCGVARAGWGELNWYTMSEWEKEKAGNKIIYIDSTVYYTHTYILFIVIISILYIFMFLSKKKEYI